MLLPFKDKLFRVILLTNPLLHAIPAQGALQRFVAAYPSTLHVHIEYPVFEATFVAAIIPHIDTS